MYCEPTYKELKLKANNDPKYISNNCEPTYKELKHVKFGEMDKQKGKLRAYL